jgi:hypothetical protein
MVVGAVAVPVAGCDLRPDATPAPPEPPTADELLVDRVVASLRTARDVALATPHGASVAAVHAEHLAALGATDPSSSPSPSAPTTPPTPSAGLRATEAALQTTLAEAARSAEDGDLARLLASMAASVAQQVAVLPATRTAR